MLCKTKCFVCAASVLVASAALCAACQESIEDQAARNAKEFTRKYCPTPPQNNTITDSVTFDKPTKTYSEYYTFVGDNDNPEKIRENIDEIKKLQTEQVRNDPQYKSYRDAGFSFKYIMRSQKLNGEIIATVSVTPSEYR